MNRNDDKLDIVLLGEAFTKKEISPIEYTKETLKKISENSHLNAFVTICEETAIAQAEASEKRYMQGNPLSPLDGVPIGIKDIIYTKDAPTSMGCAAYKDCYADKDAFIVDKLKAAGIVIPGKTNTSQFAMGPMGDVSFAGPCRNPHNIECISGGSSSGSAVAVAANLCPAAIGTDTGGSIRMPASFCGVVGTKTTFSLISNDGIMPLSTSLDCVGPLTNTVRDNAIILNELVCYNRSDWRMAPLLKQDYTSLLDKSIKNAKIAVDFNAFNIDIEDDVKIHQHKCLEAFKQMGCIINEIKIPDISIYREAHQKILVAGGYQEHKEDIINFRNDIFEQVYTRLSSGMITAEEYISCERMKNDFNKILLQLMDGCDVIAIPTTTAAAAKIGDNHIVLNGKEHPVITTYPKFTWIANFSGFPSISIPVGFTSKGMPIGFSLIARPYDEANLYRFAYQLEQYLK